MGSNDKWSKFWRQGNQRQGIQRQGIQRHHPFITKARKLFYATIDPSGNNLFDPLRNNLFDPLGNDLFDPLGNILKMLIEYTLEPKKKRLLEVPKVWFDVRKNYEI